MLDVLKCYIVFFIGSHILPIVNSISRYYCAVYKYTIFRSSYLSVAYAKYNNFVLFHFTPNYKVGLLDRLKQAKEHAKDLIRCIYTLL